MQKAGVQYRDRMSDQGIDAGVDGNVDEVLVKFAPGNSERPLGGRIQHCSERDTDTDEDKVGQRQAQHDRVGGRPQALIAGDGHHDSNVAEEAEDSDDTEDDWYDVTQHPADATVCRPSTEVCRVGLIDGGRRGRRGVQLPVDDTARVVVVHVELDSFCGRHRRILSATRS